MEIMILFCLWLETLDFFELEESIVSRYASVVVLMTNVLK